MPSPSAAFPSQLALAADVLEALTAAPTLRRALQGCAEAIVGRVDAAFARIWTLNEFDGVLELRASAGLYTHLDGPHGRVPVGKFKIGLIAEERQAYLTNDVAHDPRISDRQWAAAEGIVSFAGYPLMADGHLVGVVALFARQPLAGDVLDTLAGIADAIAVRIARDRASEDRERLLVQLETQQKLMEAVIQQMPSGLIVAEAPSGRIVLTNRQVERILGRDFLDVADPVQLFADASYHADGRPYSFDDWPLTRAVRTGEIVKAEEIEFLLGDGTWTAIEASATPVRHPGGEIAAAVVAFHEITDRRRAERRLAAQHAAVTLLSQRASLAETAGPLLGALCAALGWDAGTILEIDEDPVVLRPVETWHAPTVGRALAEQTRNMTFARGEGLPGRVWAAAAPLTVVDMAVDTTLARSAAASLDDIHGAVAVPIAVGSHLVGVLELFRRGRHPADTDLIEVLTAIAGQLGQFIERARASSAVRVGQGRQAAILEVSLDCIVSIDDRGLITEFNPAAEKAFGWRRDEVVGQPMAELLIPPPLRADHHRSFDRYLHTGESHVLGRRIELRAVRRDGTEFPIELAVARIPIDGPPAFTAYIRDITESKQAAEALYDSREQFATLARTLQKGLLPPDLPAIDGMQLAARYHPAVEGLEVGGDFYDVFRTSGSTWAAVIGDVCGKGAEAANLTALVRHTIRAAAIQTNQPAQILAMLNEAVVRHEGTLNERLVTVVYTSISRSAGLTEMTVACGGHPPPLVIHPTGEVTTAGSVGTLLGAFRDLELTEIVTPLEPGDKVVFYTDGLTEAPGPAGEFGGQRFHELLSSCTELNVSATCGRIEEVVLDYQGGESRDDMAIVVIGVDT